MTIDQGSSPGGSTQDAQSAAVSALEAGGGNVGQEPQAQPAQAPAQDGSGLVNPFLEKVDPADRAIVEKYVRDWDGGVTKKFQELHGQLQPYQELGADHETLGQAMQLMEMLDSEPERVLGLLQEALGQVEEESQGFEEQEASSDDPMASLPPEFVSQFNQMRDVLELLAGNHLEQKETQTHQQQDAELDQALTSLKEKYGEFDEDYVLAKMSVGHDPEESVKAYMTAIQGQVNKRSATPNIPAILGGGGAAPQGGNKIQDASSQDVKKLVANLLSNAQQ